MRSLKAPAFITFAAKMNIGTAISTKLPKAVQDLSAARPCPRRGASGDRPRSWQTDRARGGAMATNTPSISPKRRCALSGGFRAHDRGGQRATITAAARNKP
jgi:hypothetical protein